MAVMDALAEDDGPVVLERRRSRHGNYYEEIPPEPEPTPVPVVPEHVPEAPGLVHVSIGEPGQVLTMGDYVKALTGSITSVIAPGQWNPTTDGTMITSTSGYSISLNDVIGSYKGHIIGGTTLNGVTFEGIYDPDLPTALKAKCGHQHYDEVGQAKYTFPKNGTGGKRHQPVKCKECGHEWIEDRLF